VAASRFILSRTPIAVKQAQNGAIGPAEPGASSAPPCAANIALAIHSGFTTIKAVSGSALTLGSGAGLETGRPARIWDEKGFFGEATVTALKDNGNKT